MGQLNMRFSGDLPFIFLNNHILENKIDSRRRITDISTLMTNNMNNSMVNIDVKYKSNLDILFLINLILVHIPSKQIIQR